jgi:hypothetical protein
MSTNEDSQPGHRRGANGVPTGSVPLDRADRILRLLRAHIDTFGETIRATRGIEGLDRPRAQRDLAGALRASLPLLTDIADLLDPR